MEAISWMDGDSLRRALSAAAPILLAAALLLVVLEQIAYLRRKGPLPGPSWVVPFIGSAVPMIANPTRFWDLQAARAKASGAGLAADYLFGRFIVFVRSTELSHKIFANVRPDAFHLIGHPFGKKLFGEHNLIYMFGQRHKNLRGRIAPNFTPRALASYLPLQQRVMEAHINTWLSTSETERGSKPIPLRLLCRDMNLETSQTVFVGPYLPASARVEFNKDYNLFNVGLMAAPIDLPGFAFRNARLGVDRLVRTLGNCVTRSKECIRGGGSPACMVDFWMQEEANNPNSSASDDQEFGGYLFDFLFAAQDASTSSLLWAIALLDAHPEVLARVRAEVEGVRRPDSGALALGEEEVRRLTYTAAVAREVVRFRPPAPMVPHVAGEEFNISGWYTVPKGAIVFPSTFESSFQGFEDPYRFDPDRFAEARGEEEREVQRRHYLAFGTGSHQCVGQRYAVNHLVLFIALFVSMVEFKRHRTEGCDDIAYVPTIVPKDDCQVYLSRRRLSGI